MKVILLAAGKGSRLKLKKKKPKSLFTYQNVTILERLIDQLFKNNITNISLVTGYKKKEIINTLKKYKKKINIVFNKFFEKDTNIYSAYLGIGNYNKDVLILETDCVYDNKSFKKIVNQKKTCWYTIGKFNKDQAGGIIKKNNKNKVEDLKIVKEYNEKFKDYLKLTGALFIEKNDISEFKNLCKNYVKKSKKYYYLQPIIDNLKKFNCNVVNLDGKNCFSFNTIEEFNKFSKNLNSNIELINVKRLKHIEGYGLKKIKNLKKKILKEKIWTNPLKIDDKFNLVMDGQHRMEVAKELGLKYVPCIKFNYRKIKIWSLRPKQYKVSVNKIFKNFHEKKIYPYKTVKHFFPYNQSIKCEIKIKDLKITK